jgi:multidrug resistance efflux pump
MAKRILLAVAAVALLLGLLAYSQLRRPALKVSGFIEADEIRMGSRVGGRVAKVSVEEGQRVAAGELLISLEPFDLDARLAQAEGELHAQEAELARLEAGYREEEKRQAEERVKRLAAKVALLDKGARDEEIDAARSRLKLAEAQLNRAQIIYKRNADLFAKETGAVTRETMDRATEELAIAERTVEVRTFEYEVVKHQTRPEDLEQAQAELDEAEAASKLVHKGYREEDKRKARAAVAAAQAAVAAIKAQREELDIKAPAAGTIEALELQKGDLVPAGGPVLSMMDTSKLWVRAYVPENNLGLQIDQPVQVSVDSFPGRRFRGKVTFIARQAEFTPSNVQTPEERSKQVVRIKVTLDEGLEVLRPGMSADVWLGK